MIYLQRYGEPAKLGKEEQSIYIQAMMEMQSTRFFTQDDVSSLPIEDCELLVGSVESHLKIYRLLGLDPISPNYYPECLKHLFHRDIWTGTLEDVNCIVQRGDIVFAKPFDSWKTFDGTVFGLEGLSNEVTSLPIDTKVWLSTCIQLRAEHRVYVIKDEIVSCCQYKGEVDEFPDMFIVQGAIARLRGRTETPSAYSIDFGITQTGETVLVELGDGFAVGKYQGISDQEYFRFLKTRWDEIRSKALCT